MRPLTKFISARSLTKHAQLRIRINLFYLFEELIGFGRFLGWIPRLVISILRGEFNKSKTVGSLAAGKPPVQLAELPVHYINLDSRTDRDIETRAEFSRMGIRNPQRFPGTATANGGLGCSMSHRDLMAMLADSDAGLTMICEDDVEFRYRADQISSVIDEFQDRPALSVLCLAYRVRGPKFRLSPKLAISNNIQTAACYLVKPSAFLLLKESFQTSVTKLEMGAPWAKFANDQLWKKVQTKTAYFCIPHIPMAGQRRSYSNIALKDKFYG